MKIILTSILACCFNFLMCQDNVIFVLKKSGGKNIIDTLKGIRADSARKVIVKQSVQSASNAGGINYSYKPVRQPVFKTTQDSALYSQLIMKFSHADLSPESRDSLWQLSNKILTEKTSRFDYKYVSDFAFSPLSNISDQELPSVKNVSIQNIKGRLPDKLWRCTSIEKLEILNSTITRLPRRLSRLKNLKSIYIVNNLSNRPLRLARNKTVTKLLLRGNSKSIPTQFKKLKSLAWLDLAGCNLKSFPIVALKNKNLKSLYLRANQIDFTNDKFLPNSCIESIDLADNKLTNVPVGISWLPNLISLNFNSNKIERVDPSLSTLSKLQELSLYSNNLKEIPDAVYNMKNLVELDLYYNQLEKIDDRITNWQEMRILYLAHNKIFSISDKIGELSKLNQLYLHNNRLSDLPNSLSDLKNLKVLRINNNYFAGLPTDIDHLVNLENFDLSSNQLRTLPDSFWNLKSLKILAMAANPWEDEVRKNIVGKTNELRSKNVIVHLNTLTDVMEDK